MSFRESVVFSRSQKLGILFTFALLSIGIAVVGIWKDLENSEADIEKFETFVQREDSLKEMNASPNAIYVIDMNIADSVDWVQLPGIGKVLSKRIIKYREAIGGFHSVAQLARVYGLKPEVLEEIEPYLTIDSKTIPQKKVKKKRAPSYAYLSDLDINTATETELEKLPGIGKVLSKRIVKYRDLKGGFKDVSEIKKVYGLKAEVFENIESKLYIDSTTMPPPKEWIADNTRSVNKKMEGKSRGNSVKFEETTFDEVFKTIDINQATKEDFGALPGIEDKLAGRIIRYRDILGFYASIEQLKSVYGLSEKTFQRIQPFLEATQPADYKKKDLNAASKKLLASYPFISQILAEQITAQRKQLGWFDDWTQVKKIEGMSEEVMEQLQSYFEI